MSINWKKPREKRYQEPLQRLSRLFWFIFVNLNNSPINFKLCSKRPTKTKKINKDYDVCLLISLSILKLVNNLNLVNNSDDKRTSSKWEPSPICTDEELLLIRAFYFGENCVNDNIKNAIGEKRWKEIQVPTACAGFFDEEKEKDVRKNNRWSYLNTIPKWTVHDCIEYLLSYLDNVPFKYANRFREERKMFYTFLKNFTISLKLDIPFQSKNPFATEEILDNLKFSQYIWKFEWKMGNLWRHLCETFPKEVDAITPWTDLKRFDEYKAKPIFPIIRLAWDKPWDSTKNNQKKKKL